MTRIERLRERCERAVKQAECDLAQFGTDRESHFRVSGETLLPLLILVEKQHLPLKVYVGRCRHDDAAGECSDHVCVLARAALTAYDQFNTEEG